MKSYLLAVTLCLPVVVCAEESKTTDNPPVATSSEATTATTTTATTQSDIVKLKSAHSVSDTIDKLEALVKDKGLTVFARIDHRKNANAIDMKLADSQVLLFGNPKMGTRIMKHDIAAGLDLPLRVLAYKDEDGQTWVSYRNPQALKQHYAVSECKAIGEAEKALEKMTAAITQ